MQLTPACVLCTKFVERVWVMDSSCLSERVAFTCLLIYMFVNIAINYSKNFNISRKTVKTVKKKINRNMNHLQSFAWREFHLHFCTGKYIKTTPSNYIWAHAHQPFQATYILTHVHMYVDRHIFTVMYLHSHINRYTSTRTYSTISVR